MRLPLPKNKLVALALVGGLAAAGASVALATPGLLDAQAATLSAGAPADDPNFTPAVQPAAAGEREDEWEDEEEHEAYERFWHDLDEADER